MNNSTSGSVLFGRLWHSYIKQHWGKLSIAIFFMLLEGGAMYVFVKMLQPLFDNIFIEGNRSQILPVTIAVCGVFVIRGVGSFIHRSLTVKTGISVVGSLQQDLTQHLLSLDISFFNKNSPGGLIERVRGDTQALQAFASTTLLTLGRDAAMLVGMLAAAIEVDWMWTIIVFVGVPILILPIAILHRLIRQQTRRAREASATLSTRLDEIFHGIKAIKLNNLANHEVGRFQGGVNQFIRQQLKSEYSKAGMPSVVDIIAGVGFVAVIYYGGQEIIAGEKTAGQFMTFFVAVGFLLDPIRRLTNVSGAIQGALANLERIYYLFDQQPLPRHNATATQLTNAQGDITFNNVNFSYGDQPVLNNLSFTAPGGKTTAFVGPSGAGKSTLFNVLTQLELQQSGSITIGHQNVAEIDAYALRQHIAVVSQESALFDESLHDNILLGDLGADPSAVQQAAQTALVSQFSDQMPSGLNALAGPRGSNLSGGQRQRVIIARALLRNAPILLLDEATSALDNQTEKQIQALLDDFSRDKTTLVIAHRLTTVMNADLIHVMQEGSIVESGTHLELLARGNVYAALHKTLEQ